MSPQIIIAIVIALSAGATGFGTAWKIQDYFIVKKENEYVEQTLRATKESAAEAEKRSSNIIAAQNAATVRERSLRADAASSRDALIGVSHATGEALRAAQSNHATCLASATALGAVFETVTAERRELAEKADRHVIDVQTLLDAWPK